MNYFPSGLGSSLQYLRPGSPCRRAQDVDQRLTRDVERLCDDLSALIPSLVKPVVDIAWFSVQLYQLTGRRGMAILYLYAFLGFGALSAVTPDFGNLARKVPRLPSPKPVTLWLPAGLLYRTCSA